MDERFPKWLRWTIGKLDFVGIPNLGMLVAGLAVLGFVGTHILNAPLDRFVFDPYLVTQGEWWRLFAFPTEAVTNPIWLLFYVMYVYFVMGTLESAWGPTPLTIFVFLGYVCAAAGAFIAGRPVSIWFHVMENVSLAFGTLFPEIEFYLFFLLPVKAKWLAMFAGAMLLLQFISGGLNSKIFLLIAMFPYLLFFGPVLAAEIRVKIKVARNRKRFEKDHWR